MLVAPQSRARPPADSLGRDSAPARERPRTRSALRNCASARELAPYRASARGGPATEVEATRAASCAGMEKAAAASGEASSNAGISVVSCGRAARKPAIPRGLAAAATVRMIAAGPQHCVALGVDGVAWGWGSNASGQLGRGAAGEGSFAVGRVRGGNAPYASAAVGAVSAAAARQGALASPYGAHATQGMRIRCCWTWRGRCGPAGRTCTRSWGSQTWSG